MRTSFKNWRWGMALALLLATTVVAAERPVSFEATLILASNEPAALDRRLDEISFQLRRVFRFEHFRFMGNASASADLPSDFTMDLGQGNTLAVSASHRDGRIRAHVNWRQNGTSVLNTAVGMKRGAHAILGGIPHRDGTLIVTLVAK